MKTKKWQNLLYKKCPACGGTLDIIRDRAIMYECLAPGCEFVISRRKYADILTDETHIMRKFLTEEERQRLEMGGKIWFSQQEIYKLNN